MADEREPPPLFGDNIGSLEKEEDEDLFASVKDTLTTNHTPVVEKEEERDDIFADAQTEVPLDSPVEDQDEPQPVPEVVSNHQPPASGATLDPSPFVNSVESSKSEFDEVRATTTTKDSRTTEEIEEEASGDQYQIEITVTDPMKKGDGMGAYMAYKINTKTTLPQFHRSEMGVYRRFSDFLGLHEKLVEKHQHQGRVIPTAPEKSVVGMTKIKMSKEDQGSAEFVEKRRAALERFMNRIAKHQVLREDPDFIEFLEKEDDLPKSSSTSALSGAGMMRLFSKMGDSIGKITFKMEETDEWFEEKFQQIESLDHQLRKLHSSVEALVQYRKELAHQTGQYARSVHLLGSTEENTSLSRALSQLAEVEEKVDQIHGDQANSDFFVLAELMKDYIALLAAIKDVFNERVKIFKLWKDAEASLNKKNEERAKLESQRKLDKVPAVAQEITKWGVKVKKGQQEFEAISKTIKREIASFERQRVKDFKSIVINYLECLMNSQQQLIKHWESFLPEAKAIA